MNKLATLSTATMVVVFKLALVFFAAGPSRRAWARAGLSTGATMYTDSAYILSQISALSAFSSFVSSQSNTEKHWRSARSTLQSHPTLRFTSSSFARGCPRMYSLDIVHANRAQIGRRRPCPPRTSCLRQLWPYFRASAHPRGSRHFGRIAGLLHISEPWLLEESLAANATAAREKAEASNAKEIFLLSIPC